MNPPVTSWDALPLILHCDHIAQLLGVQVSTVWRRCQQRRIVPKPHSWQRPYVWCRDVVRAQFERGMPRAPIGRPARRRGERNLTGSVAIGPAADVRAVNAALSADLARLSPSPVRGAHHG